MNPLDAREAEETYEYPARPYTLPMRPVQTFRVLSETGDVPTAQVTSPTPQIPEGMIEERDRLLGIIGIDLAQTTDWTPEDLAWADKYLTAEDARVLRQDGI